MLTGRDKFIEIAKEMPFIADELRKANPRFTLEWSNGNSRFKYIVIQTMFDIYRIMAEKTEALEKEIRKYESKITEFEKAKTNDEVLSELSESYSGIRLYPLQKVYMDSWAPAPEIGSTMYFKTNEDRSKFLSAIAKERQGTSVPCEYTSYNQLNAVEMSAVDFGSLRKGSYTTPNFTIHFYE